MVTTGRRFTDKVVLITGGAGAIGSAAAWRFAEEGGRLAILDRDRDRSATVVEELRQSGHEALAVTADVGADQLGRLRLGEGIGGADELRSSRTPSHSP